MPEEINKDVLELWEEYHEKDGFQERTELVPLLYPPIRKECLLFIGINPAYNERYMNNQGVNFSFSNYLEADEEERENLRNEIIVAEGSAREPGGYGYFGIFPTITEAATQGWRWEHIDLFFERKSSQRFVRDDYIILRETENNIFDQQYVVEFRNDDDFAKRQLELSLSLIEKVRPKIIVVANALASKIIIAKGNICTDSFDEYGYDKIKINKKKIPIFFSGMLSGQHTVDNGSRRRLAWQIKQATNEQ